MSYKKMRYTPSCSDMMRETGSSDVTRCDTIDDVARWDTMGETGSVTASER
jgi:hypothetical protein